MDFTDILGLLGGLALFLYGMQMMSTGLEAAAGDRMKQILQRMTSNRFLGVGAGALITAVIQSSSATTVMVVGFVNSGLMTLRQAVWIIMGANIGTTITGQLIALDVGELAPVFAFVGVVLVVFFKKPNIRHTGNIIAGLGVLFIGMDMMGNAMVPLQSSRTFIELLTEFENPILGILAGTVFTAIIQSSSASVGILQALAANGIVQLSSAAYVLFGQNIGTCITALLASIGTNRNARRTTVIHISFNVIGTVVFSILCMTTPLISWMVGLAPDNPAKQIANLHTLFNIVTTLLLLPAGNLLATLSEKILPDTENEDDSGYYCALSRIHGSGTDNFGASAINMENTKKEILRMLSMAKENVYDSFDAFANKDIQLAENIEKKEEYVDFLNKEISKHISRVITHERTEKGSRVFSVYHTITGNIERISDHAMNISGYSQILLQKNVEFSDNAMSEIKKMQQVCDRLLEHLINPQSDALDEFAAVASMEQMIDDMTREYRANMLKRIQEGTCTDEGSILYSEMLTDFERIGDHALNISQGYTEIRMMVN